MRLHSKRQEEDIVFITYENEVLQRYSTDLKCPFGVEKINTRDHFNLLWCAILQ